MSARRPHSTPLVEELRELLRLAAPVVVVQLGLMLMGVVDSMMVGHFDPRALAAVALGNAYQFALLLLGQGVMLCLDPIVSQAVGARDDEGVRVALQRGIVLALVLSVPFTILFIDAAPALRALGQSEALVPLAAAYVRATAASTPAFFLFVALRQTLQAMHVLRPLIVAVVVGNVVNAIGNSVLVYGQLGAPALGAVGTGYATMGARWVMLATLALGAIPALERIWRRPSGAELWRLGPYLQMLRVGVPIGLHIALEAWVFIGTTVLVGMMNETALAGHQIAMNLASLSFMMPLGVAAAAAVRVGHAVGRGDPDGARRAAEVSLGTGAAVMLLSAAAFSLAPRLLARAYTSDPAVISFAATLLPIAALFQIFDGTQVVGCGVLRGIADTRAAAAINLFGYWVLGLPIGLWLAYRAGLGARGLWWGLTVGLAVVAVLLVVRILQRFAHGALPLARVSIEVEAE